MRFNLSKHHGLGNDFLVVDVSQGEPSLGWAQQAVQWCDRRFGLGADGLLLLDIKSATNLGMVLFNADGSRAEMSGNGIRCLVQAAHRILHESNPGSNPGSNTGSRTSWPATYLVETDVGRRTVVVDGDGPKDSLLISVDMGVVSDLPEPANWADVGCHPDRPVRHVSIGNPHTVVGVDEVLAVDLGELGAKIPQVNLEIIEPGPEIDAITMRVHERGAGITMACGTGACAAAEAALAWGLVPATTELVTVHMDGGDAQVRVEMSTRSVTLIGPVVFVASISVNA